MSELIISVSGLRGIVGESLTTDVASRYAVAFAEGLPEGPIVLTRDGRASGPELAEVIAIALSSIGRRVLNADVAATPTTGVLVREHKAAGGIQISASHNPPEYNGIKLFNADGRVIPADEGEGVRERFLAGSSGSASGTLGEMLAVEEPCAEHLRLIEEAVDFELIRQQRFQVLLDANHGAGSVLGSRLLAALGCRATVLGDSPNGAFAHPPEPTAENLSSVTPLLNKQGAAVGFCQDPDADRLALIDETGRYVGEEYTLAICVNHVLAKTPGPVVTNCSTSRMTEDIAQQHGVPFYRSAVGEANVVNKMLEVNAVIGGEGNGGAIDPRIVLVRDSMIGMALVLEAMATRGLPLSALVDELPRYAIHKSKVTVPRDQIPAALDKLESHFTDATPDRTDGLRLDWPDGKWLLVRGSNTEPIVRVFCEAQSAEQAAAACSEAAQVVG